MAQQSRFFESHNLTFTTWCKFVAQQSHFFALIFWRFHAMEFGEILSTFDLRWRVGILFFTQNY